MKEVTKEIFKTVFLEYGKTRDGWGADYWDKFYEYPRKDDMRYLVKMPQHENETRMMVVNDYSANEYRLFFLSEDQEESFFS